MSPQRRSATVDDMGFLYRLHRAALKDYVDQTWGWNEAWQAERFRRWVDLESREILLLTGRPIGCVASRRREDHIFLEYMALLPEYQRRGIGTGLVKELLAEARELGISVRLHVLRVNPARRLYERLGFRVTGGDTERHYMECSPRGGVE